MALNERSYRIEFPAHAGKCAEYELRSTVKSPGVVHRSCSRAFLFVFAN